MTFKRRRFALAGAISVLLPAGAARAVPLYWDTNTNAVTGAGAVPTGVWTDPCWNTDPAGGSLGLIGNWIAGNTAIFSAGSDATAAYTVSVTGTQTVGGIVFEDGVASLSGGTLDITGGITIDTAATHATITSAITGAGARITKTSAGTLTLGVVLNQANTYTCGVTVNAGVIEFPGENNSTPGQPNALGAAPASVVSNYLQLSGGGMLRSVRSSTTATFVIPNRGVLLGAGGGGFDVAITTAALTYGGILSGAGRFYKAGPGTLTLAGANTHTGGITVNAGKLILSANNSSAGSLAYVVNAGATLQFNGEATATIGAPTPTGPIPAAAVPDYFTLDGGTLASSRTGIGATFLAPNKGITLGASGGAIAINDTTAGNSNVYAGVITGVGGFTKTGPGTLVLTAAQTYQGPTVVARGTLVVSSADALGTSGTNPLVLAGGTLKTTGAIMSPDRDIIVNAGAGGFDGIINTNGYDSTFGGLSSAENFSKTGNETVTVKNARVPQLDVAAGTLRIADAGGDGGTCVLDSAQIHPGARFDLRDNKLIDRTTGVGTWDGVAYTGVTGLVQSGYDGGVWDGFGIVTSQTSAISPSVLTTLATASAADVGLVGSTFGGQTVGENDTLVMYTFGGDANLDGTLNGDDYFQIDSHFNQAGVVFGYVNGDFNYDGDINGDDYFIIDSNWNAGGNGLPVVTAVPEPVSLAAALVAVVCSRRRRSWLVPIHPRHLE